MTIVDSGPGMGSSADDFRRHMYAESEGDRVVWGLAVNHYANRTVRLQPGQGRVGGIGFSVPTELSFTSRVNSQGYARVDRLVARVFPALVYDPETKQDVRAFKVEIVISEGGPAENPTLPAVQQLHDGVWEFGLAFWVVPGNSNGNIRDGMVWDHRADDGAQFAGDLGEPGTEGAFLTSGENTLLLAMERPRYDVREFAVPGAAVVALDVVLSCRAQVACAGVVTLQMAGQSRTAQWKAMAAGIFTFTVPHFEAQISPYGGYVPAIVQMSVEGTPGASTPLIVGRVDAHQYQVMR